MNTQLTAGPSGPSGPTAPTGAAPQSGPPNPNYKPAVGQKDFPLYLTNNQRAVLHVPATMTSKDYKLLKQQIENHLLVIEATSVTESVN